MHTQFNYCTFFVGMLLGIFLAWLFVNTTAYSTTPYPLVSINSNPYAVPPKSASIVEVMNYLVSRQFKHLDGSDYSFQERAMVMTSPASQQCYLGFMIIRQGYWAYADTNCAAPNSFAIEYDDIKKDWDIHKI